MLVSKLKAPAYITISLVQIVQTVSEREENIVRKGENAGYEQNLHLNKIFNISLFQGLCWFSVVKSYRTKAQQ